MRIAILALALGAGIGIVNHAGVIAGVVDPPPGFEPAYSIRNLDIPQYLTWAALAQDHWLLPNYHAPWKTEPALFQPMLLAVGKSKLPPLVAYHLFQVLLYWLAAYLLIQAFLTFCHSRRRMLYASIVMIGALPLKLAAWAIAKWAGAALPVQLGFAYGVVEYSYETADGLMRGGLSNSITLTFGTAVTLFGFTSLARYARTRDRKEFLKLLLCAFVGALFHPFEVFLVVVGAIFPLWRMKRPLEILPLGLAGGLGVLPYLIQSVRSPWLRDASDGAQWHMTSPVWVLFAFGVPAILICWLMAIRFRGPDPEDDVLQSWFLTAVLLPLIPAVPVAIHLFDGFAYCLGFLLVRKAGQDKLFLRYRERLQPVAWAWGASSAAILITMYVQLYADGKSIDPLIGRPAVVARDERAMMAWMGRNLPRDRLVLAPPEMAPWVAAIPMVSMGSHDVFSITFETQRDDIARFYGGDESVIDKYGVSYVIALQPLASGSPVHQEGSLRLYEMPGRERKLYPGRQALPGAKPRNGFRHWIFDLFSVRAMSRPHTSSDWSFSELQLPADLNVSVTGGAGDITERTGVDRRSRIVEVRAV